MKAPDVTRIWQLYQNGLVGHSAIHLLESVTRNEYFYAGDQWHGVEAKDLPKPVINFIKRACQQKIANVSRSPAKITFVAADLPSSTVTPDAIEQNNAMIVAKAQYLQDKESNPNAPIQNENILASEADAELLSAMLEMDWERLRMDDKSNDGLLDACISGNMILYTYWNSGFDTKQVSKGAVECELLDNVNFFPTDLQQRDIQKQPSIIISRREILSYVKAEAQKNGVSKSDLDQISEDSEFYNQAGLMAQHELQDEDAAKVTTLTYFWRDPDTGHIFAEKTTRNIVIRPAWDTLLTRYPFAMMAWELRKNSCFGRAEITGLIPNQVTINRIYAMTTLSVIQMSWPKVLYSRSSGIDKWNNDISGAVAVNGDINNSVKYLAPPTIANDAYNLPEKLMRTCLEMMGTNDVALGNVNPTNSSAFALAAQSAQVPTQTIINRFYAMLKDFAENWLDMTLAYIKSSRWVNLKDDDGNIFPIQFVPADINKRMWSVNVEVGTAPEFSYTTMLEQMGQWLQSGQIQFIDYLEAMPESLFPNKQKMIQLVRSRAQQMQDQAMQLAQQKIQGGAVQNVPNSISGGNTPAPSQT